MTARPHTAYGLNGVSAGDPQVNLYVACAPAWDIRRRGSRASLARRPPSDEREAVARHMAVSPIEARLRADYGYDASCVMQGLLAAGLVILLATTSARWTWSGGGAWANVAFAIPMLLGAVPSLLGASLALCGAVGKMRMRDLMLGSVPWTGQERVLDVGTGAGLLLVGAAKRLTEGMAVGVDTWSTKDLSNNARVTTESNILAEGVAGRAIVQTADARARPLADGTFDRVVSLLCLHNIEGDAEQARACREMTRVLKPGGIALIADYLPTGVYAAAFGEAGLRVVGSGSHFRTALSLMWMVRVGKSLA